MAPAATRARLLSLLSEACELEHALACSYLYAAFTIKRDISEGIDWAQQQRNRHWASEIYHIAAQEMLHLGQAWNLLGAVGGTPYYARPNFPLPARWYPLKVALVLRRFDPATIERFVDYETPAHNIGRSDQSVCRRKRRGRSTSPSASSPSVSCTTRSERSSRLRWRRAVHCQSVAPGRSEPHRLLRHHRRHRCRLGARCRGQDHIARRGDHRGSLGQPLRRVQGHRGGAGDRTAVSARPVGDNPYCDAAAIRSPPPSSDRTWIRGLPRSPILSPSSRSTCSTTLRVDAAGAGVCVQQRRWSVLVAVDGGAVLLGAHDHGAQATGEAICLLPSGSAGINAGPTFAMSRHSHLPPPEAVARVVYCERLHELADHAKQLAATARPCRGRRRIRFTVRRPTYGV